MDKTMKERIEAFLKNHQWCIVVIMIVLTFYWVKATVDNYIIEDQQQQIEKYQSLYSEQREAYWQVVAENNRWKDMVNEMKSHNIK